MSDDSAQNAIVEEAAAAASGDVEKTHATVNTSSQFGEISDSEKSNDDDGSNEMSSSPDVVEKELKLAEDAAKSGSASEEQQSPASTPPRVKLEKCAAPARDDDSSSADEPFAQRRRSYMMPGLSSSEDADDEGVKKDAEFEADVHVNDFESEMRAQMKKSHAEAPLVAPMGTHLAENEVSSNVLTQAVGESEKERKKRRREERKQRKREKKRRKRLKRRRERIESDDEDEDDEDGGEGAGTGGGQPSPENDDGTGNEECGGDSSDSSEGGGGGGGSGGEDSSEGNCGSNEERAEAAKKTKEEEVPVVEWPSDEKEYTALVRPICVIEANRVLCAVLMRVVIASPLAVRETLMAAVGEAGAPQLRSELERIDSSSHACIAPAFFERLNFSMSGRLCEHDVQTMRRSLEWRCDSRTLSRRWILCTLQMDSATAGMASDYSSILGVYRLRCKASKLVVYGVRSGDVCAAVCDELQDKRAKSAAQMKELARSASICLTEKEARVFTFNQASVARFMSRETTEKGASNVSVSCFAGLPLTSNTMCTMMCTGIGVAKNSRGIDSEPFCELMPPQQQKTLRFKRARSEKATAISQVDSVTVDVAYKVGTVVRTAYGAWISPIFFQAGAYPSLGDTNVLLNNGTENGADGANDEQFEEERENRAFDEAQGIRHSERAERIARERTERERLQMIRDTVCHEVARTPEVYSLLAAVNSGDRVRKKMSNRLTELYSGLIGDRKAVLDAGKVRKVWNRARRHSASVLSHSSTSGYDTEVAGLRSSRLFLKLFSDPFLAQYAPFAHTAEALGLHTARTLYFEEKTVAVSAVLMRSPVPYVLLFGGVLSGRLSSLSRIVTHRFLPWMRTRRADMWNELLYKANQCTGALSGESCIEGILKATMAKVGSLDLARLVQERCVPFSVSSTASMTKLAMQIVNVGASPVRLLSTEDGQKDGKSCLFMSKYEDYIVERALAFALITFASSTSLACGFPDGADAEGEAPRRLVLHRCGDADDCVDAIVKEHAGETREHGKLLVVALDKLDTPAVVAAMQAAGVEHYQLMVVDDFLTATGGFHESNLAWPQGFSRVHFFNAHRFTHDVLLVVVAFLLGYESVPNPPQRMTRQEHKQWSTTYMRENCCDPSEEEEEEIYKMRVREFSAFAARVADKQVSDAIEENFPERKWGAIDGVQQHARFIFTYVAYAQCDTERSIYQGGREESTKTCEMPDVARREFANERDLDIAPHGQFMEAVYFGAPRASALDNDSDEAATKDNFWRIEDHYKHTKSLASLLVRNEANLRLLCLEEGRNVEDPSQSMQIRQTVMKQARDSLERWCREEVHRRNTNHKKKQRAAEAQARLAGNSTINFRSRPFFESGVIVPPWQRNNENLPAYIPVSYNSVRRETAPSAMSFRATALTRVGGNVDSALVKVKGTLIAPAMPSAERLSRAQNISKNSSNLLNADVSGFGRTAMLEVMRRIEVGQTSYVIACDTPTAIASRCLAPNWVRSAVSSSPTVPQLRTCPTLADEDEALENMFAHDPAKLRDLKLRRTRPYYACLQSGSAFTWRGVMKAAAEAVREELRDMQAAMEAESEGGDVSAVQGVEDASEAKE